MVKVEIDPRTEDPVLQWLLKHKSDLKGVLGLSVDVLIRLRLAEIESADE